MSTSKTLLRATLPAAALTVAAAPAVLAHTGAGSTLGLGAGFTHPLAGMDHVLAMVAVGLWAAQRGGRSLWALPAAFLGVMAVGGALALTGLGLPLVEGGIALSVLVLGLAVAVAPRLSTAAGVGLVGAFALFHGHAHGTEMAGGASALLYGLGFLAGTALLHCLGMGFYAGLARLTFARGGLLVRAGGAAIALVGAVLVLG